MKTIFKNIKIFPFCLCFLSSFVYAQAQQGSYNYTPATNAYNEGTTLIGKALNGITPYVGNGTTDSRGVSSLPAPQPGSGGDGGGWCGYFVPSSESFSYWTPSAISISCQGVNIGTPKYYWLRGHNYFNGYTYNCPPGYSLEKFVIGEKDVGCNSCGSEGSGWSQYVPTYGYTCIKNG